MTSPFLKCLMATSHYSVLLIEFQIIVPLHFRLRIQIVVLQYYACNLFLFGVVRMNPINDSEKSTKISKN